MGCEVLPAERAAVLGCATSGSIALLLRLSRERQIGAELAAARWCRARGLRVTALWCIDAHNPYLAWLLLDQQREGVTIRDAHDVA